MCIHTYTHTHKHTHTHTHTALSPNPPPRQPIKAIPPSPKTHERMHPPAAAPAPASGLPGALAGAANPAAAALDLFPPAVGTAGSCRPVLPWAAWEEGEEGVGSSAGWKGGRGGGH